MNSERHITSILNAISGDPDGRKILDAWLLNTNGYAMGLFRDTVDGEMSIHSAHLVLEALRYTDNHVVDEGSDCS